MVDAVWSGNRETACLQESAVLSSCLRAICCLRGVVALLAARGNGSISVQGWQGDWSTMETTVCCFLRMAALEPAAAEPPYRTPIPKHFCLSIPSTHIVLRKELAFIFCITSVRTSASKLSGLKHAGGSL